MHRCLKWIKEGTGESGNVPQTPWGDKGPVAFTVCWDGQLVVDSGILADAESSPGKRWRVIDLAGKVIGDGGCETPAKLEAVLCPSVLPDRTPCTSEPLSDAMEKEASLGERRGGIDFSGKRNGELSIGDCGGAKNSVKLEAVLFSLVLPDQTLCSEPFLDAMEPEASLGERRQ